MPKAQKKSTKQAKTKYDTHVLPRLMEIEAWCRDGMIDKDIAKKLGIAYSTFREYVKTESALSAALKKSKEVADIEVENSLFKKANGYNVTIRRQVKCKEIKYNKETGKKISEKEVLRDAEEEIHIAADTTAQIFWLKNRRGDRWRDRREMEMTEGVEITDDTLLSMMAAAGYKKQE